MRTTTLGRTGMTVSRLTLGTMMLGHWGEADRDVAGRLVHQALDAGINLVDTADMYSAGESEQIVGAALQGRRDDVVVATKAHFAMGTDLNQRGGSRRWLRRAVEDSLRRLRTERIDLYQVHRPDPATDVEETLSVLTDLVREGKVLAVGSSGFTPDRLVDADWVARTRGLQRLHTEQPPYSIFVRGIEHAVLPAAQRLGLGVLTWSPLNSGWLTGRFTGRDDDLNAFRRLVAHKFDMALPGNQAKARAVTELTSLAQEAGLSLTELALRFTLSHPAVTSVIIGPRTSDQLASLVAAGRDGLSDDVLDRIDEIAPPGRDVNPADVDWSPPELVDPALRRRPFADRGVGEPGRATVEQFGVS